MFKKLSNNPVSFGVYISKAHKKWAIGAIASVLTATALGTFSVVVLKNLTDEIATNLSVTNVVWMWALAYPVLYFVESIIWRSSGFCGMKWIMNARASAYQTLYSYITLHSKDYFNSRFAGSLTNKIGNAVDGSSELFSKALWQYIPLVFGLLWYIVFISLNSLLLGIIIVAWSLVFFLINLWFAKKLQPHSYTSAKALSTLKGRMVDSLSNISLVHEYAYRKGEKDYIQGFINKQRNAGLRRWRLGEWTLVANGVLIFVFVTVMIVASIMLLQSNLITVGVVIMVVAIVSDLSRQLFFLGQEIQDTTKYYGEAREGLDEILVEHEIVDADNAKALEVTNGAIDINSINFEYDKTKVFHNFSLSISKGQKVGIVGKSGAGKTTFVSLLLRHFEAQSGQITIDGQNIYKVTLESLRHAIAFVPQDTSMFHRSIAENIRYSSPDATEEDIKKAAKQAQAHDFIQKLPDGYKTLVGERGVKLSGGQRQRIAIARAFLKNAPILILDEATSSLDSQSEHAIQQSLSLLMKGRTVIAIAHRLSTLKEMDRIIIIEKGEIAEDGKPETLLKKKDGIFKKMWDHQVKGFILDE